MSSRARGWLLVVALLAPAVVLPLCVPLYDRADPEVGGWPFFFWFQMLLIVVAVALTTAAYAVAKRVDRLDRAAHGLPADVGEDPRG